MSCDNGPLRLLPPHTSRLVQGAAHFRTIAGVVEALLQNSLDAGCHKAHVLLFPGGEGWGITVFDDGSGWSAADASLLCVCGATSRATERLGRSLFILKSLSGVEAWCRRAGGAPPAALPAWATTAVALRGVFAGTPVRLAALVPQRELAGVLSVAQGLALSRPFVGFRVDVAGAAAPLLQLEAAHTPLQRVAALFPAARGLRPVTGEAGPYAVAGFAAAAGDGAGPTPLFLCTINGRVARGGVLRDAAEAGGGGSAVHALLHVTAACGSFTAVFEAAPERAFVGWTNPPGVRGMVEAAIRAALQPPAVAPCVAAPPPSPQRRSPSSPRSRGGRGGR